MVVCDDIQAAEMLAEARIEESRAPVSHPELVPGLALASARTDADLRSALGEFCAAGGTLTLTAAERWEGADWSAHTFLLTRGEMRGCVLNERTIAISVGVSAGTAPRYRLRSRMPVTRTPVGDCAAIPLYREETVLDGQDGPVRLVLVRDHEGDEIVSSEVVVRSASPDGWAETVLLEPAPDRLLDGAGGPIVELRTIELGEGARDTEKWVVAHADRESGVPASEGSPPPDCRPIPGETVWTPTEGGGWRPHRGRDALTLLAEHGLWRFAGDDGWFLIVAQDDEDEAERVHARARRLQERAPDYDGDGEPDPLLVLPSAWFPGLNPGFLVVAPPPWPTEQQAKDARAMWKPRRQAYVKRGWQAPDACGGTTPP